MKLHCLLISALTIYLGFVWYSIVVVDTATSEYAAIGKIIAPQVRSSEKVADFIVKNHAQITSKQPSMASFPRRQQKTDVVEDRALPPRVVEVHATEVDVPVYYKMQEQPHKSPTNWHIVTEQDSREANSNSVAVLPARSIPLASTSKESDNMTTAVLPATSIPLEISSKENDNKTEVVVTRPLIKAGSISVSSKGEVRKLQYAYESIKPRVQHPQPCFELFGQEVCQWDNEEFNFCLNAKNFHVSSKLTSFCFPQVMVIGVAKSGTTSMHSYLKQHPMFYAGKNKELHYWGRKEHNSPLSWYFKNFDKGESFVMSDSSPSYFSAKNEIPKTIAQYTPNVRLILLLREPVARLVSEFFYFGEEHGEKLPDFAAHTQEQVRLLRNCSEEAGVQWPMLHPLCRSDPSVHTAVVGAIPRVTWSLYVYSLMEWLKYFDREQLLVIRTEDFKKHPQQVMDRVFDHIFRRTDKSPKVQVRAKNQLVTKTTKKFNKLNANVLNSITPNSLEFMYEFFEHHNAELANVLGDESFLWNDTPMASGKPPTGARSQSHKKSPGKNKNRKAKQPMSTKDASVNLEKAPQAYKKTPVRNPKKTKPTRKTKQEKLE